MIIIQLENNLKSLIKFINDNFYLFLENYRKNMLLYNVSEKNIIKYTKVKKKQFDKIKEEFENENK